MDNKHFVEEDVKDFVDFLNTIATKAIFNSFNIQEAHKLTNLYVKMAKIKDKIEANVFEIKKVTKKDKQD